MKRLVTGILIGATFTVMAAGERQASATMDRQTAESPCGTATAQVRTTLYFGTTRPKGTVSELEWQMFLRDEVTSRFPDGLTVWEAEGQWKAPDGVIGHERSKVLLLVHGDTTAARGAVQTVIDRYRKAFDQQSVLWETARVCAAV
jgi:hypothetical protein